MKKVTKKEYYSSTKIITIKQASLAKNTPLPNHRQITPSINQSPSPVPKNYTGCD
jgi:hypothetical protein